MKHESGCEIYVEVSTLLEPSWSGIANVTANLCRSLLASKQRTHFFAFDKLIRPGHIEHALRVNDGGGLQLLMDYGIAIEGSLQNRTRSGREEIAIFPNFKRGYQDFDFEVLIVHDLSFILMPELHEAHLIEDYKTRLFRDVHSVNRVVCVSNATRDDLITYYAVPSSKVSFAHLGVDGHTSPAAAGDSSELRALNLVPQRYFLVLGTIEPRKNIELVIDYLAANRRVLDEYKFVFAGRNGWGKDFQSICAARGMTDPRVIHLGYVSEPQRKALLQKCTALLFPSWFEGFGLPVLEAMAIGTPVIGSRSSSIVEVGGSAMIGFEPGSLDSFSKAIDHFLRLNAGDRQALSTRCMTHARTFTWNAFRDAILSAAGVGEHPGNVPAPAAGSLAVAER